MALAMKIDLIKAESTHVISSNCPHPSVDRTYDSTVTDLARTCGKKRGDGESIKIALTSASLPPRRFTENISTHAAWVALLLRLTQALRPEVPQETKSSRSKFCLTGTLKSKHKLESIDIA